MKTAEDILDFWFSDQARSHWFASTDRFDALIRQQFEPIAMALAAGPIPNREWEDTPRSALAMIIALDQFSRNMYRGTQAAFAWDPFSLGVAQRLVDAGGDLRLDQGIRKFAYMPFMHAEDIAQQERCVQLCDSRLNDETIKHAITHRDIIARFGRFPHRNAVLGRETTADEQAFLDQGGFNPN